MFLLRLPIAVLILLYQSVVLALGQLWANKVRSTLTTVGIVIGIASVTAVIAALSGLKANVLSEFESLGTNKIFIFPRYEGRIRTAQQWKKLQLKADQFEGLLEHCPDVSYVALMNNLYDAPVSYNGQSDDTANVQGIDAQWHMVENRSVVQGRPFSLVDLEQARPVCLINARVQEKFGLGAECTGQSIMIGPQRFMIVGIVETRQESSMFGERSSGLEVFVPFTYVQEHRPWSSVHVTALSRSPEVSEEARAQIAFFLRQRRHLRPDEPDNFRVEAVEKYLQQFNRLATIITMVATGIVGISLVVGGVGIMNIMLVSVSERTREIGLRKAVGARPSAILFQFLVEAVMLCFLGGALGTGLGQAMTMGMAAIPSAHLDKAFIPGWAVALSFGFAALVGLVFGIFPAIKAATLDPIEALRHE